MTNNAFNPFMMPNFGQGGADSANNPLIASMEMMRHAMAGMSAQTPGDTSSGGMGGMGGGLNFAQALNPEDIERRISELKVVENWLKLNLSMLTSTIQGLEVQLATIQTLKSFAAMGAQANEASQSMQKAWSAQANQGGASAASEAPTQPPMSGQSPLEAALGMMPSAQSAANANTKAQAEQAAQVAQAAQAQQDLSAAANLQAAQAAQAATAAQASAAQAVSQPTTQTDARAKTPGATIPPAGQAWWNMLEKQFSQIATATQEATQVANEAAAKLVKSSQAVPDRPAGSPAKKAAVKHSTPTRQTVKSKTTAQPKATAKPTVKSANKSAAKPASKSVAKPSKPTGSKAAAAPRAVSRTSVASKRRSASSK